MRTAGTFFLLRAKFSEKIFRNKKENRATGVIICTTIIQFKAKSYYHHMITLITHQLKWRETM